MFPILYILEQFIKLLEELWGKYKKEIRIFGTMVLILLIMVFWKSLIPKEYVTPKPENKISDLEQLWSPSEVEGLYKAMIEDKGGSKRLLVMKIKKVDNGPIDFTIECVFPGYENIKHTIGRVNLSKLSVFIPGLGVGKMMKGQFDRIILNFMSSGKKLQFIQSNI